MLVAVGSKDAIGGSAQALADLLPAGQALEIPGRDHMTAVGDKVFKQGVLGFLAGPALTDPAAGAAQNLLVGRAFSPIWTPSRRPCTKAQDGQAD